MPQMKIKVMFLHSLLLPVDQESLTDFEPGEDFILIWHCQVCESIRTPGSGLKLRYDGRFPAPDCPDCKKREEAGQVAAVGDETAARVV
jgi:hypothetical protein